MLPQSNRSCPKCGHWRMYVLERYTEDEINESPTIEGWGHRVDDVYLLGWLFNLLRDKGGVEHRKSRLRKLRAEVLPRAPNSLVCPKCFEVIERF